MGRLKNDHVEVPLNTGGLYDRLTARPSHGISTVQSIFKTTCLYSLKKMISVKGMVMYSYLLGKG